MPMIKINLDDSELIYTELPDIVKCKDILYIIYFCVCFRMYFDGVVAVVLSRCTAEDNAQPATGAGGRTGLL